MKIRLPLVQPWNLLQFEVISDWELKILRQPLTGFMKVSVSVLEDERIVLFFLLSFSLYQTNPLFARSQNLKHLLHSLLHSRFMIFKMTEIEMFFFFYTKFAIRNSLTIYLLSLKLVPLLGFEMLKKV